MGTYLAVSLVTGFQIPKKHGRFEPTLEQAIECITPEMPTTPYDFTEDEQEYTWSLKPLMLEGNALDFFAQQFELYDDKEEDPEERDYNKQALDYLRGLNDGKCRLECLRAADYKHLGYAFQRGEEHGYVDKNGGIGFNTSYPIVYEANMLFMQGKCQMECYSDILNYFQKVIALQKDMYPIAECIKVFITG